MHIRTRIPQALAAVLLLLGVSTLRAEDRTITKGDTIVVTAGQVEVRAEDKTIATVSKGQRFKVIAVSGNWLGIEVRGETGWIVREDAAPAAMPRAAAPRARRRKRKNRPSRNGPCSSAATTTSASAS